MFEYDVLEATGLINKEQMNKLAEDGWRLVTIAQVGGKFYFYIERRYAKH